MGYYIATDIVYSFNVYMHCKAVEFIK